MNNPVSRVLVTGANGFIGKNLLVHLQELPDFECTSFVREDDPLQLPSLVANVDVIVHLAGENRPFDEDAFEEVNVGLTALLCEAVRNEFNTSGRRVSIIFASSAQAGNKTPYGQSKLRAEQLVRGLAEEIEGRVVIFRLPGVFGKWCRPNYNSVVSTFCHNIARKLPIRIDDPSRELRLVYIDDVVSALLATIKDPNPVIIDVEVCPEYNISLANLEKKIRSFEEGRDDLFVENVGCGLTRALYATYVSSLPTERFSYEISSNSDERGIFVEILKTRSCGQISFLTALPGVTRGGHYHHTKIEKFLVVKGDALFRYRHLLTGERLELRSSGEKSQIVETIPGWSHDITNIGEDELVVILWANEAFDPERPDTISSKV